MFSIKKEEKNIRVALILIEVIFALIALLYILKFGDSTLLGSMESFDNDDVKYIRRAWNLVENKILSYENITEPTVYIMPGLTFILSGFVALLGKFNAIVAFRIFQIFIHNNVLTVRGQVTPRWRNYLFLISARLVRRNQQLRRFFAY